MMRTSKIIFIWMCIIAVKKITILGYAIDNYDSSRDPREFSEYSGMQAREVNEANKPVVVLPVDINSDEDKTNESDLESIIHPGHKMKRCKSLTPLRKARLSPQMELVNNDERESQSSNSMNKNGVTFPSSKLKNNPVNSDYTDEPIDNEETHLIKSTLSTKSNENIDPNYNDEMRTLQDKIKRSDEQNKKYVCYCLDEDCLNDHPKRPFNYRKSYKNSVGSQIFEKTNLHSQLNVMTRNQENSQNIDNQSRKLSRTRPNSKRLKSKNCTPYVVPCEINDNPVKLPIPINTPSTMDLHQNLDRNYQSFHSPVDHSRGYYGSPYLRYHTLDTLNLENQHENVDEDQLSSIHRAYDNSYVNPHLKSPMTLEECIRLYGRDYCLNTLNQQYQFHNNYHHSHHHLEDESEIGSQWNSCNDNSNSNYSPEEDNQENILDEQTKLKPSQFPTTHSSEYDQDYDDDYEDQSRTGITDSNIKHTIKENPVTISNDYDDSLQEEENVESQVEPEYNIDDEQVVGAHEEHTDYPEYDSNFETTQMHHMDNEPVDDYYHEHLGNTVLPRLDNVATPTPEVPHDNKLRNEEILKEDDDYMMEKDNNESPISEEYVSEHYHDETLGNPKSEEYESTNYQEITENSQAKPAIALQPHHTQNVHRESEFSSSESSPENENDMETENIYIEPKYRPEGLQPHNQSTWEKEQVISDVPQDFRYSSEDNYNKQSETESVGMAPSTHKKPQEARQPEGHVTNIEEKEEEEEEEYTESPRSSKISLKNPHQAECYEQKRLSASAEKHLKDLQSLTGLSTDEAKLLRATIYKTVHHLASNVKERVRGSKLPSRCDIIGAPEPAKIKNLGDGRILHEIFKIPEVRNLARKTVKQYIPQVIPGAKNSSLGKLTDSVLETSLKAVLGENTWEEIQEEPQLGVINKDDVKISDRIVDIVRSIINRPGIGPQRAKIPGIQNIIVRTLEDIGSKAKNVIDNSVIWDALHHVLNNEKHSTVHKIKRPKPSAADFSSDETKPLPVIPVTEHFIHNGHWEEGQATVGYQGQFPETKTSGTLTTTNTEKEERTSENIGAVNDYALLGDSSETEPTTTQVLEVNDDVDEEPIIEEYDEADENTEESILGNEKNHGTVRIPLMGQSHEITTERYHKSYTKTKQYVSPSGRNQGTLIKQGEKSLGEAREFSGNQRNSRYFGKISSNSDLTRIDNVEDLIGSDLYYIGDGVKLPLTVTRLNDGSFALSISNKICEHFVDENCPCCSSKDQLKINNNNIKNHRETRKRIKSRVTRATTANNDENTEIPKLEDNTSMITEMPIDKFTKKYNLTLDLDEGNKEIISWAKNKNSNNFENNNLISQKNMKNLKKYENNSNGIKLNLDFLNSPEIEENEYIRDLLSIHDVPEENRAEIVINALDGLLNSSTNENNNEGFEYQINNPIMERIKYLKKKELEHGKYKYQKNLADETIDRMETVKNIIHWLKELIVKSNTNELSQ